MVAEGCPGRAGGSDSRRVRMGKIWVLRERAAVRFSHPGNLNTYRADDVCVLAFARRVFRP